MNSSLKDGSNPQSPRSRPPSTHARSRELRRTNSVNETTPLTHGTATPRSSRTATGFTSLDGLNSELNSSASSIVQEPLPRKLLRRPSRWYIAYYIPALDWMRKYRWESFPGDFCSGVTLASFQIPISLSYATSLAGVDAVSGLYGLIVAPLVYALLGSVPPMVVAPEGPISLLMGKLSAPYVGDPPAHRHGRSYLDPKQVSGLMAGSAGAIILFLGLARTGFLTNVLSQSLLRGFVTGVGVVMIADQLPAMLGFSEKMHHDLGLDASSFAKAKYTWQNWRQASPIDTSFSLYGLLAILLFKALKRYLMNKKGMKRAVLIPDILIVVIVSTVVSKLGQFAKDGLPVVGEVKTRDLELVWMLRPKYWSDFKINFQSSFFIALLGLLESTVAARILITGESIRSTNRELVALGSANVVGAMFGSLPSFGGYGRSKINLLGGGTTQMSAIVSALVTLLCTYKLMGSIYYLPRCTLSAVIASVGITLLEEAPHDVKFFWNVGAYSDLFTMFLSLFVTFFWSVEAGVAVGTGAALVRVIHHATRPRIQILTRNPGTLSFENADDLPGMPPGSYDLDAGILVVKIPEPLTFANSAVLEERLRRIELHGTTRVHPGRPPTPRNQQLKVVVFHLKGMTECDASAASQLHEIICGYLSRGVRVIFTEVVPRSDVQDLLESSGINSKLRQQPWDAFYATVKQAITDIDENTPDPR